MRLQFEIEGSIALKRTSSRFFEPLLKAAHAKTVFTFIALHRV